MLIRVFWAGKLTECDLEKQTSLSIGSGPADQVCIQADGIVSGHVTLIREGSQWKMHCEGEVSAQGRRVTDAVLSGQDAYVLSRSGRVVLTAFEAAMVHRLRLTPEACPVSIGRAEDNTAVISCLPVSKHHCVITCQKNAYYIQDLQSSVGTFVNGKRVDGAQKLQKGVPVVVGQVTVQFNGSELELYTPSGVECRIKLPAPDGGRPNGADSGGNVTIGENGKKYLLYQRSPRLKQAIPKVDVEIEAPPSVGGKPEINWLSTLLPSIITVGIALLGSAVFPTMLLYSLPMTAAGVFITVSNYKKQTKKFQEQQETRLKKYTEHLDSAVHKIEKTQEYQLKAMLSSDPDTERCFDVVKGMERTLWDRRPVDEDFCAVRIGSGPVRSAAVIKVPKATITLEDDELRERPEKIKKIYSHTKGAPITCNLKESHICGIVGSRQDALILLKNMLVQYAVHQSYTEAKLVCVYDGADEGDLGWVKDLPHAMDEERKGAFVAASKEDAARLLAAFAAPLKERRLELESDNSYGAAPQMLPYYLFVVAQPAFMEKDSPINEYLLRRSDLGAGLIMVVEDITQLPKECDVIINVRDGAGEIFHKSNTAHKHRFVVDRASFGRFGAFSKRLKHVKCDEPGKKSGIPKNYTFYDMQDIDEIRDWDIAGHWSDSDITKTLSAPIGVCEGGALLWLDMIENGPHGLVAGTTGAGKSEVMLSYLLSLALRYPPSEVSFMIIDFKGGGMANQLAELPHLVGTITNIDEGEINRSLASIKAELIRRQRLFKDAKVEKINEYIRLFKSGAVTVPLPHLIILVDEFAELKAAHPEFMSELISAARIGRSLGAHLILATQKPAGQVSEDIWSNSRFQICLRVASREDSSEVIKSPLAFNIREPGRAYLHVGDNEVFELFQSGYSGVKTADGTTQLDAVVQYIAEYCREEKIPQVPRIFLPVLPVSIDMPAPSDADQDRGLLSVGMYDDPENQYQGELQIDPFRKNTFILGSSLSGKTNLLQTVIRAAADTYSPEEVNIYLLDFSSMTLKSFERLRHVGGVVTSMEDEKLKNLFKLLSAEIDDRRKRFLELGVSSYAAYLEAGRRDKPHILLMIDNLTALRELYFADDDPLLPICQNGLAYGVSVIISNTQTAGVGYKYLANFANRIAMFCNDSGEYNSFFDTHCTLRIPNFPGRCIVERDKKHYVAQIYRSFAGEKEVERAQNIRCWAADIDSQYAERAVPIPEIPEILEADALLEAIGPQLRDKGVYTIGLDYENVSPVEIDLDSIGMLGLAGKDAAEPRGMVRWLMRASEALFPDHVSFYLGDSINRGMAELAECSLTATYEYLPAKITKLVTGVEAELARRYDALMSGEEDLDAEKLLVLVLAGTTSLDAVSGDAVALTAYKNIVGKYKALKVCIILSECDNVPINYSSPEIMKKLKEEQKLVFFGGLDSLKMLDVPYAITKKYTKPLTQGDGFFILGSECRKIKTPSV